MKHPIEQEMLWFGFLYYKDYKLNRKIDRLLCADSTDSHAHKISCNQVTYNVRASKDYHHIQ